jgi:hypothetical protein
VVLTNVGTGDNATLRQNALSDQLVAARILYPDVEIRIFRLISTVYGIDSDFEQAAFRDRLNFLRGCLSTGSYADRG